MNKRIKQLWIEILRSGKYKQGRNKLRNINNEFCCLGVLCDIISNERNINWILEDNTIYSYNGAFYKPNIIDLEYCNLSIKEVDYLIDINDNGYSFSYIANFIEQFI